MDKESNCGSSIEDSLSMLENTISTDVLAKLRRLKIQESIISASLTKCASEDDHPIENINHNPKCKLYTTKIRDDINEIKNMFEDIKITTGDSKDNLKNIDIQEIKKDILNLNDKIKSLEEFINTELKSLQLEESEFIKQINDEPKPEVNAKRKVKLRNKQYNEVVPSPVRVLINSPLKCKEVQQFQAFMSKSKNRYGGWNEYNHNIFVQIWNKFYAAEDIVVLEKITNEINRNKILSQFKDTICEKIPGIQLDDIILHSKWYSELCYLKRAQKLALDKWKDNRRKIKGRQRKQDENNKNPINNSGNEMLCRKQNGTHNYQITCKELLRDHEFDRNEYLCESSNAALESSKPKQEGIFDIDQTVPKTTASNNQIICKQKSSTFASPTEQWINRCNDNNKKDVLLHTNSNIETVNKLCVPNWRLKLHNYDEENENI